MPDLHPREAKAVDKLVRDVQEHVVDAVTTVRAVSFSIGWDAGYKAGLKDGRDSEFDYRFLPQGEE